MMQLSADGVHTTRPHDIARMDPNYLVHDHSRLLYVRERTCELCVRCIHEVASTSSQEKHGKKRVKKTSNNKAQNVAGP